MRDALKAYVHEKTGALVMNRGGFRAIVEDDGVAFVSRDVAVEGLSSALASGPEADKWGVRYRLTGLSTAEGEIALGAGTKSHAGAKVTIDRGGVITEEYENLPEGLEQRFVVHTADSSDFVLRGALEGSLEARLVEGDLSVLRNDEEVLHASAPRAWDATGAELETSFLISPGPLDVEVRGANAYPVLVDPAWTSSGDDQPSAEFGWAATSAGDVNADGFDDVVIGAAQHNATSVNAGKAYLYLGSATGLPITPAWTSSGDDQNSSFYGRPASSAGDVNGDGFDDIIVGAFWHDAMETDAGKAYVYVGSSTGLSAVPVWTSSGDDEAEAYFGYSVSSAGDVNGDGFDDIIVGAHGYDTTSPYTGKTYLYLGTVSGPSAVPAWTSSGDGQPSSWYAERSPHCW